MFMTRPTLPTAPRALEVVAAALAAALLVLGAAACGPAVELKVGLPIALLSCPAAAEPGVPFTVDASASSDDEGDFAAVSLLVGAESTDQLVGTFTVPNDGVTTAVLSVTDQSGNLANATCRIIVGDPLAPVVPGLPSGGVDLSGSFALVAYDRPQLTGGALTPSPQCAPAPSVAMVELAQAGGELTMTMKWCSLEIPDVEVTDYGVLGGLEDNELPDSTTALLPAHGPATFPFDGRTFAPPLDLLGRAVVTGAVLTDPVGDPLPVSDGVTDDDNDGTLGVPMTVDGTQYNVVVRRVLETLSGDVVSSDVIEGSAEGSFAAYADIGLLDPTGVMQSQAPTGAALPSTFRMQRVDDLVGADGVLSCADLAGNSAQLFAALPELAAPQGCHVPTQR